MFEVTDGDNKERFILLQCSYAVLLLPKAGIDYKLLTVNKN